MRAMLLLLPLLLLAMVVVMMVVVVAMMVLLAMALAMVRLTKTIEILVAARPPGLNILAGRVPRVEIVSDTHGDMVPRFRERRCRGRPSAASVQMTLPGKPLRHRRLWERGRPSSPHARMGRIGLRGRRMRRRVGALRRRFSSHRSSSSSSNLDQKKKKRKKYKDKTQM